MISKKTLTVALSLVGASVLSAGCNVVVTDTSQYLQMQAAVYDIAGNALDYNFDYYLNMTMRDGTLVSFHQDQQATDVYGNWGVTLANPQLFVSTGTATCYDSCVSYDEFGCTAYATDCYSNDYTASFDTNDILPGSTEAFIGIDTGYNYVTFGSSLTLKSGLSSYNTFTQSDEFDTNVLVLGGATASSKKAQLSPEVTKSVKGHTIASKARVAKPAIIKDLTKLTAEQQVALNKTRAALHIPARQF